MFYNYVCNNEECIVTDVTINKNISESSNVEYCKECKQELTRSYKGLGAIKTGDGFKHK